MEKEFQKKYGLADHDVEALLKEMRRFNKSFDVKNEKTGDSLSKSDYRAKSLEEYLVLIKLGIVRTSVKSVMGIVYSKDKKVPIYRALSFLQDNLSLQDLTYLDIDSFEDTLKREIVDPDEISAIKDLIYEKMQSKDIEEKYDIQKYKVTILRRKGIDLFKSSIIDVLPILIEKLSREKLDEIVKQSETEQENIDKLIKTRVDIRKYLADEMKKRKNPQEEFIEYLETKATKSTEFQEHWKKKSTQRIVLSSINLNEMCIPRSIVSYLNAMGIQNTFDVEMFCRRDVVNNVATYDYDFTKFEGISEEKKQYTKLLIEWSGISKQIAEIYQKIMPKVYRIIKENKENRTQKKEINRVVYSDEERKEIEIKRIKRMRNPRAFKVEELLYSTDLKVIFSDLKIYEMITTPLEKAGITSIGKLLEFKSRDLKEVFGIGEKKAIKIKERLEQRGLKLGCLNGQYNENVLEGLYDNRFVQDLFNEKEEKESDQNMEYDPIASRVRDVLSKTSILELKMPIINLRAFSNTSGIQTIGELLDCTQSDLINKGVGKKVVSEIKTGLEAYGMSIDNNSKKEKNEMYRSIYMSDFIQRRIQEIEIEEIKKRVGNQQAEREKTEKESEEDKIIETYKTLMDYYMEQENIFDLTKKTRGISEKKHSIEEVVDVIDGIKPQDMYKTMQDLIDVEEKSDEQEIE